MSFKSTLNAFFDELKANFRPAKPITNWKNGYTNTALLPNASLVFMLKKGTVDVVTTSASIATIDCLLFIQNMKSATQQDDLVQYLDDIYNFLRNNPRLGGVQEIEINGWDVGVSEDGINEGLLSLELTLTARI